MKPKDKQNLLKSWPIYAMFIMMLIGLVILNRKHPPPNEPLGKSISRHFEKDDLPLDTRDNIINARITWNPIMPNAMDTVVGDFQFVDLDGVPHRLSDFSGQQVVVFFFASWSPGCKQMRPVLQEVKNEHDGLILIGLSTESTDQIKVFVQDIPVEMYLGRQDSALPEPFNQVMDLPTLFFIRPDGTLKLAATGLIPYEHLSAIIDLYEEANGEIQ